MTTLTPALPRPTLVSVCIAVVLGLGTFSVYAPVRQHSFVSFDDPIYVTENPMVQAGLTAAGFNWAFTTGHGANWHPLTWLSHMLDCELFGPGPAGSHLMNLFFHIANTLLLFVVLHRLTSAVWRSALVAALFALHPLHVESVAWVAERKDVLSAFFFLLTLWAYVNYSASSAVRSPKRTAWLGCALLLFALGLMSKPMLVTLPCVLLLLDYWPLGRIASGVPLRVLGWEKAPFFLLSAVSCIVTFIVQSKGGAVQSLADFSIGARIENAFVSYARYLGKTFWPTDLAVFYPHPGNWPVTPVVFAIVLVAGACLVVLRFRRSFPFAAVGWFWFFGMMIPTIGLVQVSDQSLADRYTYLPSIGLFVALAWSAGAMCERWRLARVPIAVAATLATAACAARTGNQLGHWQNSERLFRHAIAVTPPNAVAQDSLGNALLDQGRVDEALGHFQTALAIEPDFADAHNNFGDALLKKNRTGEAIVHFEKAIELHPRHVIAYNNLADVFVQTKRPDAAVAHYRKVVELQPDFLVARHNLGMTLFQTGQREDAIAQFRTIAELQPDNANSRNNLGWILLQNGRLDEATTHLEKALAIRPDYPEAHNNLGKTLAQKGQSRAAATHYQTALRLQPDNVRALSNLAWLLATCPDPAARNGARAMELAQRADELSHGKDPASLQAFAAASAECGRFADAVTIAGRALDLAGAQSNPDAFVAALRSQLKVFEAGSPFRESDPR